MLHMDDGGFSDSLGRHTVTNYGVTLSSTESKFGGKSALFSADYLSITGNRTDFDFG